MRDIYWLWLSMIPNIGPVLQKKLLKYCDTPENLYYLSEKELQNIVKGISSRAIKSLFQYHSLEKAKRIHEQCSKRNIQILTIDNPNYFEIAKVCPESPIVLYVNGKIKKMREAIAIVGSRRCSTYGKRVTEQIAAEISKHTIPIISGMAKGIDGYAHTAAIKYGGYTLAFLANGVDICYPPEHRSLYEQIIENGAILSKFPPGTRAHAESFLQRNALISAWSNKLIVVEAGEKSGALTTAKYAHKYSRDIFAVPNRIDEPNGTGSNLLLETIAKPYLNINSLNLNKVCNANIAVFPKQLDEDQLFPCEKDILVALQSGPIKIAEIQRLFNISTIEIVDIIYNLELKGRVKVYGENILLK